MIHTTFRIKVTTPALQTEDLFDTAVLLSVFKSASATHEIAEHFGLPELDAQNALELQAQEALEEGADNQDVSEALLQVARGIDSAIASATNLADKADSIGILNRQGRLITPEALDTYRETFVMRRSFGIPNTERTNIDTSSKKLPKILPEDVKHYFPVPSAEQLVRAMTEKPKTKNQLINDACASYPKVLPSLGLRVSLLHRPLWEREDEVARHNWKKIMRPQLDERLDELQKDLLRLEVPSNIDPQVKEALQFSRLELCFDKYVLSIENTATNRFGDVGGVLDTFYTLLNDGVFGDKEVVRIDAPFIDYDLVALQNKNYMQHYFENRVSENELARHEKEEAAQKEQAALDEQAEVSTTEVSATEASTPEASTTEMSAAEACTIETRAKATCATEANTVEAQITAQATTLDAATDQDEATAQNITLDQDEADKETSDTDEPGEDNPEEEEQPQSHYQGLSALRFSEQTIHETHRNEYECARAKAQEAAILESEKEKAAENGGIWMPALRKRVWGVIFSDGSIAYLDSVTKEFCDLPEIETDDEANNESVADDDSCCDTPDTSESTADDEGVNHA